MHVQKSKPKKKKIYILRRNWEEVSFVPIYKSSFHPINKPISIPPIFLKNQKSKFSTMETTQKSSTTKSPTPHLAIIPSPGMGHLIPLIEFSKRLVSLHRFSITFLIPSDDDSPPSKPQISLLNSLPPQINHLFLPPVSFHDLPPGSKIETLITLTVSRSLPSIHDILKSLSEKTNLVGLVVDLFGTDAFDVAEDFNLSRFIFFPSTASVLSLMLYLPKLDETVTGEFWEMQEPVKIPGCVPINGKDLLDPIQDRKNEAYKCTLHNAKRYKLADGILVNSFPELEPGAIKALRQENSGNPPVYPIGPLVKIDTGSDGDDDNGTAIINWLDEQPNGSVLFVSFGSGGTLKSDQINELAMGLEKSEQRFIWVIRSPSDKASNATYFSVHSKNDPLDFLPKGFIERIKKKGLVVPSWAPQAKILSHNSTGGFLTHCGWNSTLESVVNGVPLIAWPLYAEQKMNAAMLADDIKVALRLKVNEEKRIVEKEEIEKVVKCLMEGEEGKKLRTKMKDLKDAAERVVGEDGSSSKLLSDFVLKLKTKISS